MALSSYYEIEKVLTGTLPSYVYVVPVVDTLSNVTITTGSGSSSNPALTGGRYIAITGAYLRIHVGFNDVDSLRKLLIFKIT